MAYTTTAQVTAEIPEAVLRDAVDDVGDGQMHLDVLEGVIANADQEVDGYLGGLFTVPFVAPVPAKVKAASLAFTIERIYTRRGTELPKRWAEQAKFWRDHLQSVGSGKIPFDAAQERVFAPGAAVTADLSLDEQGT